MPYGKTFMTIRKKNVKNLAIFDKKVLKFVNNNAII